ncbi:hypothetical protein, partial [uncultured Rikenella sp.]|uniref:hypothetical protein n=1 Tax=uncultured Rikenella sp. TaxID=368003 RepID=UPI0026373D13
VSAFGTLLGSSSPLGNLQIAFALLSLAASVVNKRSRKNFRRMLRTLQLPMAQSIVRASGHCPG